MGKFQEDKIEELTSYLEYLKYQKNYSEYTIESYKNDIFLCI